MGISGVGSNPYNYYGMQYQKNNTAKSCSTVDTMNAAPLNYNIYGDGKEDGKALGAIGFPDGSSSSNEVLNSEDSSNKTGDKDFFSKMAEQYAQNVKARIENGDSEPAYQIGGQTFTEEEWNKLLEKVETAIDSMKAETAEVSDKKEEEIAENLIAELFRDRSADNIQNNDELNTEESGTDAASESSTPGMTTWYQGKTMEEWSAADSKYTDPETGISWYVREGKYPYMVGEDAEKFQKLCEESGEFALKKFAEMTGLIRQLDDNTVAYVGDNGIAVKSKDGKEMFIDTSQMTYDVVMDMFNNPGKTDDYFSEKYWSDNIQKALEKQRN